MTYLCAGSLLVLLLASVASGNYTVVYEAASLQFVGDPVDPPLRKTACLAGVKHFAGVTYVTVPRWLPGVPSSLNVLTRHGTLRAYPSLEMNQDASPFEAKLVYVQSMEIDPKTGHMWIIDVGRTDIYASSVQNYKCPKLVIWSTISNKSVDETYLFPDDVVPGNNSFMNDLVIAPSRNFVYISDTWASGGIIVYQRDLRTSRRFDHPSMHGGSSVTVNGTRYPNEAPSDGIALSPDSVYLYYCALSRRSLYRIETRYLNDFQMSSREMGAFVELVGAKGFSDGLAFDNLGRLFFGDGERNALMMWKPASQSPLSSAVPVAGPDDQQMVWQDTLAFDGRGSLIFSTNNLFQFFAGKLDWSQVNFRLISIDISACSYLGCSM